MEATLCACTQVTQPIATQVFSVNLTWVNLLIKPQVQEKVATAKILLKLTLNTLLRLKLPK